MTFTDWYIMEPTQGLDNVVISPEVTKELVWSNFLKDLIIQQLKQYIQENENATEQPVQSATPES